MMFISKDSQRNVNPIRELAMEELGAVSGGEKTVCTTVSKTTVKGNTSTTVSTTVCTTK